MRLSSDDPNAVLRRIPQRIPLISPTPMKTCLLALAALLVAARLPAAETSASAMMFEPPSAATEAMPGIAVGEKAPDFTLENSAREQAEGVMSGLETWFRYSSFRVREMAW
jgi:hypothetical protein